MVFLSRPLSAPSTANLGVKRGHEKPVASFALTTGAKPAATIRRSVDEWLVQVTSAALIDKIAAPLAFWLFARD